jgi:hypothetical protein
MSSRMMWALNGLLLLAFLLLLRPSNSALFVALTLWLIGVTLTEVIRETRR